MVNGSQLKQFYNKKSIFLTGATGFLGTGIVEKLLRSFPQVDKIYLLIRNQRNAAAKERSETYFQHYAFSTIPNIKELTQEKVVWIHGDLTSKNLNIQDEQIKELQNKVDLIVHCAASINFASPLYDSIKINLGGTKHLLELAKNFNHLKNFVYVSSAFLQTKPTCPYLEEKIYEHQIDPDELLVQPKEFFRKNEADLCKTWANTYTYSKNAAENLVAKYVAHFPSKIYRPGSIIHAFSEPIPYWRKGRAGLVASFEAMHKGLELFGIPDLNMNAVPVDFSVNSLLAMLAKDEEDPQNVKVYNFSSQINPIGRVDLQNYYVKGIDHPIIPPKEGDKDYEKWVQFLTFFKKIYRPFLTLEQSWSHDNFTKLWASMDNEAKKLLPFDLTVINWEQFLNNMYRNIKHKLDQQ